MENGIPASLQTLASVEVGIATVIESVTGAGRISRRLMEMGLVPGVRVRVIKRAPFGDPIEVRIRGYNLALRLNEAETIRVTESTE